MRILNTLHKFPLIIDCALMNLMQFSYPQNFTTVPRRGYLTRDAFTWHRRTAARASLEHFALAHPSAVEALRARNSLVMECTSIWSLPRRSPSVSCQCATHTQRLPPQFTLRPLSQMTSLSHLLKPHSAPSSKFFDHLDVLVFLSIGPVLRRVC